MDSPGYIKPDLHDLLLTDITANELRVIAAELEVDYLGQAVFPRKFPAMGRGRGYNHRLMVPLVCRRQTTKQVPTINIIFLIDTGSTFTYLCQEVMEALIGRDSPLQQTLWVRIHSEKLTLVHISPPFC